MPSSAKRRRRSSLVRAPRDQACASYAGSPQDAPEEPAALRPGGQLPARTRREPATVGLDAADTRPPVGEVEGLREERPDVLGRREQLAGCSGPAARLKCCDFGAIPRRQRCGFPAIRSHRGGGWGYRAGDRSEGRGDDQPRPSRLADAVTQQPDEVAKPGRGEDRDHDRAEAGQRERDQRPEPDLAADQARDALRVDQDLPHLQPRDEGRGHPGAVALEELDQVEMRPDGDDQLRAPLVREQQGDVLADPGCGDGVELEAQPLEARGARRGPVRGRRGRRARRRSGARRRRRSPCRRRSRRA